MLNRISLAIICTLAVIVFSVPTLCSANDLTSGNSLFILAKGGAGAGPGAGPGPGTGAGLGAGAGPGASAGPGADAGPGPGDGVAVHRRQARRVHGEDRPERCSQGRDPGPG